MNSEVCMKRLTRIFIVITILLSFMGNSIGMQENTHYGLIDKLMLLREMAKNGIYETEKKILIQPMEEFNGPDRLPFIIWHYDLSNDGSALSDAIFPLIQNNERFISNNTYNQKFNHMCLHLHPIDECTCLKMNDPHTMNRIDATSTFADKPTLIALFKELIKEIEK